MDDFYKPHTPNYQQALEGDDIWNSQGWTSAFDRYEEEDEDWTSDSVSCSHRASIIRA
jgi:hypothetical protein